MTQIPILQKRAQIFNERLQSLPLPDFVQKGTAQMNKNAIVQTSFRNRWM